MILYAKLGGAILLLAFVFGVGFRFGGMGPAAALQRDHAAQSQAIAKAVLAERAAAEATALQDHATEATHAQTIVQIDAAPPIRTPILLCGPGPLRAGAMPSAEAQTGGIPADPAERGGERVGGERDIRPGIEALKRQLEKVMADYRQLDAEWPH